MEVKVNGHASRRTLHSGDRITGWLHGRLPTAPSHVPSNWELVHLTSVARLESGHTPSKRHPEYWSGDIPWISLHDSASLDVPEIHFTALTISSLGLENSSARLLPKGTVVFSRTATVGKSTVMGRQMATSQDFANYVCGRRLHNHYLVHLFRFMAPEWKRLMAGSTHNSIYMPVFQDLQILLPPYAEQEAIAEVLSDADALIESLEQLFAKKRRLKQCAMQELLNGKKRLPGFEVKRGYKQTEAGVLPEDWEVTPLSNLLEFRNGVNAGKKAYGAGIPFINVLEVVTKSHLKASDLPGRISLTRKTCDIYGVRRGDLVFNRTSETQSEIGLASVFLDDEPVVFGGFVIRARPISGAALHSEYASYALRSPSIRRQIAARGQGAIRANIGQTDLRSVLFPLPSLLEQRSMAAMLADIDDEINALETKLAKARQIKQGMMQELLTGRIRLV